MCINVQFVLAASAPDKNMMDKLLECTRNFGVYHNTTKLVVNISEMVSSHVDLARLNMRYFWISAKIWLLCATLSTEPCKINDTIPLHGSVDDADSYEH